MDLLKFDIPYPCKTDEEIRKINEQQEKEKQELKLRQIEFEIDEKIGRRFLGKTVSKFEVKSDHQKIIKEKLTTFCKNISENVQNGRSLFFTGNKGAGKTHLAAAIYNAARMNDIKADYKLSREITREIKESWNNNKSETEIIKKYSSIQLLIIDEIGLDYGSETNLNIISEIFDNRYRKMKSTVLIGNIENKEQFDKFIGPRIESRLNECGEVIYFDADDYRKTNNKVSKTN